MKKGMFMDIVSVHYKDIKNLFRSRMHNKGVKFDEDSFNDAFIKCSQHFGNEVIDYDIAVKYFWVAYVNTCKTNIAKEHNSLKDEFDCSMHDSIDEDEPTYAKNIYNIIMAAITEAFSEEDMMIYSLYKYHNWTEQELVDAGHDCKNLNIRIQTIHKFVKAYAKKYMKSR
jgi:hypothetical protein